MSVTAFCALAVFNPENCCTAFLFESYTIISVVFLMAYVIIPDFVIKFNMPKITFLVYLPAAWDVSKPDGS